MSDIEDKVQANSPYNDGWTREYYKNKLAEDIVDDKEKRYIYESPDGGKTIYSRRAGDTERTVVDTGQMSLFND